jgi:hypothetical protein
MKEGEEEKSCTTATAQSDERSKRREGRAYIENRQRGLPQQHGLVWSGRPTMFSDEATMPADPCPAWGRARAGEMVGPIHPGRGAHASNATQLARNGPRLVHTGCQERRAQASQEEVEPRLHRASSRERASDMRSSARGRACPCPCPRPLSMSIVHGLDFGLDVDAFQ